VLDALVAEGGDPRAIVESRGLGRAGGDELAEIVERAMADQADAVEQVRAGNDKAIGAIIGAVMRQTKGRADGGEVQRLIRERIGS
jgi:aspartyl-tRNA(Asn)/glutamyl-tRNA(Gln) amidotransferase subunit B